MFDISWTEFLLIGIVALIVIGPKELPAVMRSLGQWTRKIRSLAADFQNQFHEAMREAEMADLKKQVDDVAQVAQDIKQYDPLKDVRADVEAIGKDLDESVKSPDRAADKDAAAGADSAASAPPAEALPIPQAAAELRDKEVAGAGVGPAAPGGPAEATSSGGGGRPQ
ncbi:MAG TPA: Sec-independent protein translocase protein TatB [Xanthobacteraceae bacterium]|nr:Sec-independent protein translocase protein TatB [Xanthobacteraceae bacterium]